MNWRLFTKYLARIILYMVIVGILSVTLFWLLTISMWFLLIPAGVVVVGLAAFLAKTEETW